VEEAQKEFHPILSVLDIIPMPINPIDKSLLCPSLWEKFSPISLDEQLIEHYYSKHAASPSPDRDYNHEMSSPDNTQDDNNQDSATMIEAIDGSSKDSLTPFLATAFGEDIGQGLVDLCKLDQMFPSFSYCNKKQIGNDQDVLSKLLFSNPLHLAY
jgi:hypothetical protein